MAPRRVLVVSNARLSVHRRDGRSRVASPAEAITFDAGEPGLAEFSRYLHRYPTEITCVIADVVEEEFREGSVPHVPVWERRAMLRARARRAFRDTRFVHAMTLGREPSGRRDDRVLFSAITRPAVLTPWLEPMERYAVPLAGIWSPALLTGRMLKAVGAKGESVLVASLQSGGGLRQTWLRHGRLRLSRLAPVTAGAGDAGTEGILAEIERTRRYLERLEDTADASRIEVHVLGHGSMLDALRRAQRHDAEGVPRLEGTLVDLADAARRLGQRSWGGEAEADRLFVQALLAGPPSRHYAPPEATRRFNAVRLRTGLNAATAVLFAGGCAAAGVTAFEGMTERGHAQSLARQAAAYERRYEEAQATLPAAPAAPAELDRAVETVNLLRERRANPVDLFEAVSRALAEFPEVRLERIAWRTSTHFRSFDDVDADRDASAGHGTTDFGHAGGTRHRAPKALFQLALVSARIAPFDGDYRAALATIQRLVDALSASAGVGHVRVVELPLDLGSGQTLSGDTDSDTGAAEFEILVALRVAGSESSEA